MEQENQGLYPLTYSPIPKGIIKEELEEPNVPDEEEPDEHWEQLNAYPPLQHGVFKEESQSGDGLEEFNSGMQIHALHVHQQNPVAYSPIRQGAFKEEATSDGDDDDDDCELVAYPPVPHGVVKMEPELEDGQNECLSEIQIHAQPVHEENPVAYSPLRQGVVKEEATSDGDDDNDDCELVAYPPVPHGVVKTEPELEDGQNEFLSEIQMTLQGGNETRLNHGNGTFVDSSNADNGGKTKEPDRANKRKRSSKKASGFSEGHRSTETRTSSRILRSHSKGTDTTQKAADDGDGETRGKRTEKETLGENDPTAKEKQQGADEERSGINERSSLTDVEQQFYENSSDDDFIPNHSAAGPSQSKQKAIGKSLAKVGNPEEISEKPFKCKNCGSSFGRELYLKQHLARTCGVVPRFDCNECGHQFKRKDDFKQHLMTIHHVKKSQLPSLGAGPKIRPTIALEKRSGLPYKCDKCGKTFKLEGFLARHLNSGCGDSSFPCYLCDYQGQQKIHLVSHLMSYHKIDRSQVSAFGVTAPDARPVQPFKCDRCEKSYTTKAKLARHLKFECGTDPKFSCSTCDFRTKRKDHLNLHIIRVHGIAPS